MKKKTAAYLAIGVVGIALALAAKFLLQGFLSNAQSGAMVGVGAGLFGYGVGKGCVALWGEKHPDLMKQSEIEEKDERNQLIRSKAQAISGEILHWLLIAGACLASFWTRRFGSPCSSWACSCSKRYWTLPLSHIIKKGCSGGLHEICHRAFGQEL